MTNNFDLTPDPRVLQMLGEINLDQWKCIAELIDNSVDAFINARRAHSPVTMPQVVIQVPTAERDDAFVSIRDNGQGMSIEQLETAVRAGWSGNNPLDSLGLFGMGFNIATARLGMVTEVYTTRRGEVEWTGLRIDLDELRRTRSYHTPRQTKPKADPSVHGTEIRILRLKPEQRAYFSKSSNLQKIRRQLARVYAPLLLSKDTAFRLQLNGQQIQPKRHCHWSPERFVQGADGRPVHAIEAFDFALQSRRYCTTCMTTFSAVEPVCPRSGKDCKIVEIKRRLHGWVGLQRYMHEEDFGIDLIRNGRVIEVRNKDLFVWNGGERPEREYPIDDQRNRGRFIGEIHLDHCRVSYTKDRFERDDPAWTEMDSLVRGEGPLQPQKARSLGFGPQDAPLYRLFQAFRRSSPQGKTGRWSKILVVKNNERAIEMADSFDKGDPDYQLDDKWYELVEEDDRALVGAAPNPSEPVPAPPDVPPGFIDTGAPTPGTPSDADSMRAPAAAPAPPPRQKIHELSHVYKHPLFKFEFNVEAFAVESSDPALPNQVPWLLKIDDPATRTHLYLVQLEHPIFRSSTMTPADALLAELSLKTYEFFRESRPSDTLFANILAEFRSEYATESRLDSKDLIGQADQALREIALSLGRDATPERMEELFNALPESYRDHIRRKLAAAGASSLQSAIHSGVFLAYADAEALRRFVSNHPELFFDGRFWDQPYTSLDYGSEKVNQEARERVLDRFDSYLADAVWLASQSPRDLDRTDRESVIRAALSLRLLRPDRVM